MGTVTDEHDDYFVWLCANVQADARYEELLLELYFTDFEVMVEIDESRAVEGLMLREEYYNLDRSADWVMFMRAPCTVLEALIAMARRLDGLTTDENCGDRTRVWFWDMIGNLGLKQYTNFMYEKDPYTQERVFDILKVWMDRGFESDGHGSPFPLEYPKCDQRSRSMMYQMYDYVDEKCFDWE